MAEEEKELSDSQLNNLAHKLDDEVKGAKQVADGIRAYLGLKKKSDSINADLRVIEKQKEAANKVLADMTRRNEEKEAELNKEFSAKKAQKEREYEDLAATMQKDLARVRRDCENAQAQLEHTNKVINDIKYSSDKEHNERMATYREAEREKLKEIRELEQKRKDIAADVEALQRKHGLK